MIKNIIIDDDKKKSKKKKRKGKKSKLVYSKSVQSIMINALVLELEHIQMFRLL